MDSIGATQGDGNPTAPGFAGGSAANSETLPTYKLVSGVVRVAGIVAADGDAYTLKLQERLRSLR